MTLIHSLDKIINNLDYKLLNGDTSGIFQFESNGMKDFLIKLRVI